jgi:hypothetical protein
MIRWVVRLVLVGVLVSLVFLSGDLRAPIAWVLVAYLIFHARAGVVSDVAWLWGKTSRLRVGRRLRGDTL